MDKNCTVGLNKSRSTQMGATNDSTNFTLGQLFMRIGANNDHI